MLAFELITKGAAFLLVQPWRGVEWSFRFASSRTLGIYDTALSSDLDLRSQILLFTSVAFLTPLGFRLKAVFVSELLFGDYVRPTTHCFQLGSGSSLNTRVLRIHKSHSDTPAGCP